MAPRKGPAPALLPPQEVANGYPVQVPSRPSNRAVIERVIAWGGVEVGHRSGKVRYRMPDGSLHDLQPVGTGKGNPPKTVADLARSCCVTTSQWWWAAPGLERDELLAEARAEITERMLTEDAERRSKLKPVIPRHATPPTPTADPKAPAMPAAPPAPITRERGHARAVHEAHTDTGQPMTADRLAEVTGLTRARVIGAGGYLVERGLAERPVKGTYRATALRPQGHKVDIDVDVHHGRQGAATLPAEPLEAPSAPEVPAPAPEAVQAPPPVPVDALPLAPVTADVEEELATVLDLLFPGGIKGRHLGYVNRWQQATAALIAAVRGDG